MKKREDKPAALDHVLYEIEMLTKALLALRWTRSDRSDDNAWLESFAIHARNLNEFFGDDEKPKSFMRANHFVEWTYTRIFDRNLHRRASAQVAHLTYDRDCGAEKSPWPVADIFSGLQTQSQTFLKAVAANPALMAHRSNRSRTEYLLHFLPKIYASEQSVIVAS